MKIKEFQKQMTKGSAAVIKYRNLLKEYGKHKNECMLVSPKRPRIGWHKCSCGWTEIANDQGWAK